MTLKLINVSAAQVRPFFLRNLCTVLTKMCSHYDWKHGFFTSYIIDFKEILEEAQVFELSHICLTKEECTKYIFTNFYLVFILFLACSSFADPYIHTPIILESSNRFMYAVSRVSIYLFNTQHITSRESIVFIIR